MLRFAILLFAVACFLSGALYSLVTWDHATATQFGLLKVSRTPSEIVLAQFKRASK